VVVDARVIGSGQAGDAAVGGEPSRVQWTVAPAVAQPIVTCWEDA
jgi:hypothetical protein